MLTLDPLADFSLPVRTWFSQRFTAPTLAQTLGFPQIHGAKSTLLLAPTGSGKTLTAFLSSLDRLMTGAQQPGVRVLYISPLKALAVDIEKNLRAPIEGIVDTASTLGVSVRSPRIAVRMGDTPSKERAHFLRHGADLVITTPESLYLLLTSQAAKHFAELETVIVDELHSLLPTKRGAHLFLSLERLEAIRTSSRPLQRIGLSATQEPVDEAARLLGGARFSADDSNLVPCPVTIVDARTPPLLDVTVRGVARDGSLAQEARSAWPDIHAPLLELIRSHRSTLIFVNSRRLAERLAHAINALADEELVLSHHGSLAKERRAFIEDALRSGSLRALVATSSLELGIDMGSIDLVIQIDAPPSVASGLQRIGRAGHQAGVISRGVFFPKHRGELLATAAIVSGMRLGDIESTRYPRNPLDVLAQQIVATVSMAPTGVDKLFALCKRAAPFAQLPRSAFNDVLELLSGRYPSDEFAALRPRITWNRNSGEITARASAKRAAILGGGTIADRGLYGVFLSNSERPVRVGELDEEMVFESRVGEIFLLGSSSFRIDEITHDRVLVSPAPGQPGKMPFWRGAGPGRPAELGRRIGVLTRKLESLPAEDAQQTLIKQHGFDATAARELTDYLSEQREATRLVPSDRTIVVERYRDELSGYRVCILSPFGQRVHAPWALAIIDVFAKRFSASLDTVWSDDGIVFRLPEACESLTIDDLVYPTGLLQSLVVSALSSSSLFAARFRENAGRTLLLVSRDPRKRTPLWAQRRRASDLLRVASRYPDFPVLRETYRECLSEVFDLPALSELFSQIQSREVTVSFVETPRPSPFASSILFSYVGNFLYEQDAPLQERKAQALSLSQRDLEELLGHAALRELLSLEVICEIEDRLQQRTFPALRHADDLHDLLLHLGDRSDAELRCRSVSDTALAEMLDGLISTQRIFRFSVAGEGRVAAIEDLARLRDVLGIIPPQAVAPAFLEPTRAPLRELVARYARTHGPFSSGSVARRYAVSVQAIEDALQALECEGRVIKGEFVPGRTGTEWCDVGVLQQIRYASLARLRKEIEPLPVEAFVDHLLGWQGVIAPSAATDALDIAIDRLQGFPIAASVLTGQILKTRVQGFFPGMLDAALASGSVTWVGIEGSGIAEGKIALYQTCDLSLYAPPPSPVPGSIAERLRAELAPGGAFFFAELCRRVGGFPPDLLKVIWQMVWASELTNDTLLPFRTMSAESVARSARTPLRMRRPALPGSEGRWSLIPRDSTIPRAEQLTARAELLLERYGIVCREIANADHLGTFSELYPVLQAMENTGRVRRGYFVRDLGAAQYALAPAFERLRKLTVLTPHAVCLAATDPANPYGSILPWPEAETRPQRVPGASVFLYDRRLLAYLSRGSDGLTTFLPSDLDARNVALEHLLCALKTYAEQDLHHMLILESINGCPANGSPLAEAFTRFGFTPSERGLRFVAPHSSR